MLGGEISIAQLQAKAAASTPTTISLEYLLVRSHELRTKLIERAIDWIGQEMTKTRQHRQERSEDELTIDVVGLLKSMGIQATHDTQYGGHCDIVVEAEDDYLWIAEAKSHNSGYDWLLSGFEQLDRRYSTGLPGQDQGAIIIYHFRSRADRTMLKWKAHLTENRPDVQCIPEELQPLSFRTVHTHETTGAYFYVRHTIISLHFEPTV